MEGLAAFGEGDHVFCIHSGEGVIQKITGKIAHVKYDNNPSNPVWLPIETLRYSQNSHSYESDADGNRINQ